MDDRPDPHEAPSGFPDSPGKDPNDVSQDVEAPDWEAPKRDELDQ